jgi:hypothetical protein
MLAGEYSLPNPHSSKKITWHLFVPSFVPAICSGISKQISCLPSVQPQGNYFQILPEVKATQQAMIESRQLQPIDQLECVAV